VSALTHTHAFLGADASTSASFAAGSRGGEMGCAMCDVRRRECDVRKCAYKLQAPGTRSGTRW
jgi:hypothetical protein